VLPRRSFSNWVLGTSLRNSALFFPEVRLVNGRTRCQGRVEIFYNNTWGTVCDDDWDIVDANVVCRQLGCSHAIGMPPTLSFGRGQGPIFLDNVDCKGREAALSECSSHGWGIHNCYHYEDVAVMCNGTKGLVSKWNSGGIQSFSLPVLWAWLGECGLVAWQGKVTAKSPFPPHPTNLLSSSVLLCRATKKDPADKLGLGRQRIDWGAGPVRGGICWFSKLLKISATGSPELVRTC
uniref:SRCR domain-containing protein n=1 Tax=Naja naja TaxID=35670 RepID=A0A8C6XW96_NAJNA